METARNDECPRCAWRELPDYEYKEAVRKYAEQIAPDLKTPDLVYGKRLEACASCGFLQNGMCRLCGCFVEMRAAKRISRCPKNPPSWEMLQPGGGS